MSYNLDNVTFGRRSQSSIKGKEKKLARSIEKLREDLHQHVGAEYHPEKFTSSYGLSKQIDELVVKYLRMVDNGSQE